MSSWRSKIVHGNWRILVGVALLLICGSCTRLGRVSDPEVNAQQSVGHDIRVTMIDGRVLEFRLLEVTEDALIGEGHELQFDKIAFVERPVASFWRTACCLLGGIGTALAVLVIALWDKVVF